MSTTSSSSKKSRGGVSGHEKSLRKKRTVNDDSDGDAHPGVAQDALLVPSTIQKPHRVLSEDDSSLSDGSSSPPLYECVKYILYPLLWSFLAFSYLFG